MKKKSTSRSAFFNLRVLAALLVGMTGVSLALFAANPLVRSSGPSAAPPKPVKQQPYGVLGSSGDISLLPPGFDCAKVRQLHFEKQENFRAHLIMKACGMSEGNHITSTTERASTFIKSLLPHPLAYGSTDVDVILPDGSFPHIVQSETYTTANPDDPTKVMVCYNDSQNAPSSYSACTYSTDGGTTFTTIHAFPNTFGDPVVLYNKSTSTWYTAWIDGNAGCTMGGFKSNDPLNPASWTHYCAHSGVSDDRESGWVENNPSSPFFGRMYLSWNDFGTSCGAGGCLFETFSSDGGASWHSPIEVQTNTSFFSRDVQITGDMAGNGNVYIASMDEGGGGFPHNDTNYIYKSTDGGVTWTNPYIGSPFPAPGVCSSGYFAGMFTTNGCYWRHEGWGEPAVYNNVVSLVYAQHGTGSDPGDVYYIRSTDGGSTFGTPFKLNSDTTDRPQWQPNISVSPSGTLLATWYDGRVSTDSDCVYGSPSSPCYQMFSRKSNDNGATWLGDDTLSDVVSPLPAQPDGNIQPTYAGDYDYGTAIATKHMTSWDDGRVPINSTAQQDVFTDRELVGFSVTTSNPACGSFITGTGPTDFTINLSDPAAPSSVQPTDFTVNGTPANTANLSNGNQTIDFIFNTSPVTEGSNTMNIPAGAILQASNNDPILEFNCTFRWGQQQLTVTDTNPPVGGTFNPPAPGSYPYDVNWNIAVDPTSVSTSDLQVTGNAGATVTAVQVINGGTTTEFTLQIAFGGSLNAHIAAGAITDTFGNPNADFAGTYSVSGCPPTQYVITPGTDTINSGNNTTDTGNHCDDCDTMVTLPFPFQLYDQTYNAVSVDSNGRLDFVCQNEPGGYNIHCLPPAPNQCAYDFTIFPLWNDQRTDQGLTGCASLPGGNCGIFTSVEGSAPNRIFHIEFRTVLFSDNNATQNYEARLYENDPNLKFEIVFGALHVSSAPATWEMWVNGVQGNSGAGFLTQNFCNPALNPPPSNVSATYEIPPCASPTPTPTPGTPTPTPTPGTPTPTPTPGTPTPTPTATATATPVEHSPTPRPIPTPHRRPTRP
jgi:hypothetical protein